MKVKRYPSPYAGRLRRCGKCDVYLDPAGQGVIRGVSVRLLCGCCHSQLRHSRHGYPKGGKPAGRVVDAVGGVV